MKAYFPDATVNTDEENRRISIVIDDDSVREHAAAVRRARKMERKRMERDGIK